MNSGGILVLNWACVHASVTSEIEELVIKEEMQGLEVSGNWIIQNVLSEVYINHTFHHSLLFGVHITQNCP